MYINYSHDKYSHTELPALKPDNLDGSVLSTMFKNDEHRQALSDALRHKI